ncbi:helix-turn-helix DNA binding domain protein [Arthrobacter phage Kuleana]|uniref:Helix-turn-helix DNA binding domain protein n=1 Tax=Arthrobacter phage Kuleana TaxID=2653270 RepID=A0A5Q2WEL4_9CAUD|nr:helix-turn-helix DNA binding domain protein [Arthrobacter phage Kuleana]QGH74526.1 helix-turn-helix DNA binding domain protein [Arthrobacter phage Kuleana]
MEQVRVFIMPRRVEGLEGVTTALRLRMDELEIGVHRLKAASGVNHQTLANLANGVGGVELQKARRIADALEVPVGSLFLHKDGAELVGA